MLGCEGNFFKLVREGFKVSKKGEKAISKKKKILWKMVQTTRLKNSTAIFLAAGLEMLKQCPHITNYAPALPKTSPCLLCISPHLSDKLWMIISGTVAFTVWTYRPQERTQC